MAKIYISSTYGDLKDHREAVYKALRALKHDVIAMEDYVAADERPVDKCLADVATCDLYVGIFAWRYGYVPGADNRAKRSITELEYRKATDAKRARLIFLLDEEAPWLPKWMDSTTGENDQGARIKKLRRELRADRVASFFKTPDELARLAGSATLKSRSLMTTGSLPRSCSGNRSATSSFVSTPRDGIAPSASSHATHRQNVDLPDPGAPEMYNDRRSSRFNSSIVSPGRWPRAGASSSRADCFRGVARSTFSCASLNVVASGT